MGTFGNVAPEGGGPAALDRRKMLRFTAAASLAAAGTVLYAGPGYAIIWEEGELQCRAIPPEKDPDYDIDDQLLSQFMKVSETLTGVPLTSKINRRLGRQYLERFSRISVPDILIRDLIAASDQPAAAIMSNSALRKTAEQLIYLWYLSAFFLTTDAGPVWIYGTAYQYERALLWTIIGAHAPMMPMPGVSPLPSTRGYWAAPGQLPKYEPAAKAV